MISAVRRSEVAIRTMPDGDGVDFLPEPLAVWARTLAAEKGVQPLDVVTECVRDGHYVHRGFMIVE